jgi:hypothetical protein
MFFILFLITFIFGIFTFIKKQYFIYFIYLFLIIPSGAGIAKYTYKSGLFYFDGYFIGVFISLILYLTISGNRLLLDRKISFLTLSIIMIYILYFIFHKNVVEFKYVLKDLRPVIYMVEAYLIYIVVNKNSFKLNIVNLIVIASLSNIFFWIVSFLGYFSTEDAFYSDNAFRYIDATTYFLSIYIIYYFANNVQGKILSLPIILALFAILISNTRFLIFSIIITIIIMNLKNLKKFFKYIFLSSILISIFVILSMNFGSTRVVDSFSKKDGVSSQFINRFSPALNIVDKMDAQDILIGKGIGTYFKIPWFEYRKNIEDLNITIDSLYLTLYPKYGLVSLIIIFIIFYSIYNFTKEIPQNIKYLLFLSLVGITSAFIYQTYFMGMILAFYVILLNIRDKKI